MMSAKPLRRRGWRSPHGTALWALALSLATAGCASLGSTSGSNPDEVAALKQRVVELQRRATAGEVEVARLKAEISALEKELAEARTDTGASRSQERPASARQANVATEPVEDPTRPGLAEGSVAVEDIGVGAIDLAGGVEEAELEDPPAPESSRGASEPGETAPGAEVDSAGEIETEAPTTASGDPPDPSAAPSAEAIALYDEGYTLFHQHQYDAAEAVFRRYLGEHPDTELADNAQFWVGECRYARDDFEGALDAFMRTIEEHPNGNKVADALLKAGKSLEALGRREQARQTYNEVTNRFPSSAAAAAARERLAVLP